MLLAYKAMASARTHVGEKFEVKRNGNIRCAHEKTFATISFNSAENFKILLIVEQNSRLRSKRHNSL